MYLFLAKLKIFVLKRTELLTQLVVIFFIKLNEFFIYQDENIYDEQHYYTRTRKMLLDFWHLMYAYLNAQPQTLPLPSIWVINSDVKQSPDTYNKQDRKREKTSKSTKSIAVVIVV